MVKMKPNGGKQSTSCQTNPPPHNPCREQLVPNNPAIHRAIAFAVHKTGSIPKKLCAFLVPRDMFKDILVRYQSVKPEVIQKFDKRLRSNEEVYICVPLSEDNDNDHLPLKDYTLR